MFYGHITPFKSENAVRSKLLRAFFFIIGSWCRWQKILITRYTCGENKNLITKNSWLHPLYSDFLLMIFKINT